MKKHLFLAILLLSALFSMAQSITVEFTAEDQNGNYFQLDAVKVTSISQNWNQTLAYPDTTLILSYVDGLGEHSSGVGLLQNRPNPFYGTTETIINLVEDTWASVQLFDLKGTVLAEYEANLDQGDHVIKVYLAKPQMALLRVSTSRHSYVAKLLNLGNGGENRIEISGSYGKEFKLAYAVGEGPFAVGDVLSYVGIKMQGGDMVLSNNTITQAQYTDDTIIFVFNVETPEEPQLPLVITNDVSEIEITTAVCGGEVISDGGAEVVVRGVCWATMPNPTINDSCTTDSNGLGGFVSSLSGLVAETMYYVRAYATNSVGTAYGEVKTFTTRDNAPEGAVNGLFSIGETAQVYFSQGNLQYKSSNNNWRFAENQWDFVGGQNPYVGDAGGTVSGSDNGDPSIGWIDLYPWGSGDNPTGIVSGHNITFTDWGSNPIENGGNEEGIWRTLYKEEWNYVFNIRNTNSGIRYAKAQVNDVNGVILLPDDWDESTYYLSNTNNGEAYYSSNVLTVSQWTTMENAGAVFLPAAGWKYDWTNMVYYVGSVGCYWTADGYYDSYNGYSSYFYVQFNGSLNTNNYNIASLCHSVRLVMDAE